MWFRTTVGFSLYMTSCLNILFDILNVTNVVFEVRSSSFRHHEPSIIRKWGCQRLCMFLWYIKSYGSQTSIHSHSPSALLSGLHCPIKKIWGLETAGVKEGKRDPVWVRERANRTSYCVQFVSCRFLPVKSDDINEKMKLRADAQHCLNVRNAVCVCLEEMMTCWSQLVMNCLPNRPTAAGLQWCSPYTHLLSLQAGMLFLISNFIALPQWAYQEEHAGGLSLQQRSDLAKSTSSCDEQ